MARAIALRGLDVPGGKSLGETGGGAECDQSVAIKETGGREKRNPKQHSLLARERHKRCRSMQEETRESEVKLS